MKTSFVFVLRRRVDQGEYIPLSDTPLDDQDQYIRLGHTFSRRLQDFFKTSCEDIFKTSCQDVLKTSSKRLQNVLQQVLQGIFKTSWKDIFNTVWRWTIRLSCLPKSRVCLSHTSEKFMVSVENLRVWQKIPQVLAQLHCFSFLLFLHLLMAPYSGLFRTWPNIYKKALLAKKLNGFNLLTIFEKKAPADVRLGWK